MSPRPITEIPDIIESIPVDQRFGHYFSSNAGRLFDEIVLTTDRMRFEAGDLVAIGMLSVKLHAEGVATLLLDRQFSSACSDLLREIPTDLDLWELAIEELLPGSPAFELWSLIRKGVKGAGSGVTVISKLIAAKRPRLFPVWDQRVDLLVTRPDGKFWEPMHRLLSDEATRDQLIQLTADAPRHVSLLRRIDVPLWRHAVRAST